MTRKKRIVWVPYGYRLRTSFRQGNKVKQGYQAALNQEPLNQDKPDEKGLEEAATYGVSDSSSKESLTEQAPSKKGESYVEQSLETVPQIASFEPESNPYKAYLNDMMLCLEGIPRETFVQELEKVKPSDDVVSNALMDQNLLENYVGEQTKNGPESDLSAPTKQSNAVGVIKKDGSHQPHLRWLPEIVPSLLANKQ